MSERMLELAERCEQSQDNDIHLFRDVGCSVWGTVSGHDDETGEPYYSADNNPPEQWQFERFLEVGAFLDAARSLIAGYGVLITLSEIKGDGMPYCVVGDAETSVLFEAVANTMPLALCAASLKARASITPAQSARRYYTSRTRQGVLDERA